MFQNKAFHNTHASRKIERFVKSFGQDKQTLRETGKGRQGVLRSTRKIEDIIKMTLKMGSRDVNSIHLFQRQDQC
jgi:hypothetical protein